MSTSAIKNNKNRTEPTFIDVFVPEFLNFLKKSLPGVQQSVLSLAEKTVRNNAVLVQKWTVQASTGHLTTEDLKWLIKSSLDLSGLETLREAGLSLVRIDELRQAVVSSLLVSIFKTNILR